MLVGMFDKKDLVKWDQEDTDKLYQCEWIKTFEFENIENNKQRRKYYNEIYKRLILCLPKPELAYMNKQLSSFSITMRRERFENIIRYIVSDMRRKLVAHEIQKSKQKEQIVAEKETSFQEYRANKLLYNNDIQSMMSNGENTFKNEVSPGYYPTTEILQKLPPIEIINYIGFKLTKYDKFCGYYAAILEYPQDDFKLPEIFYNTNPQIVESEAEYKFDEEINKYMQKKANPYGDKTYNTVDISNIEQVMDGGDDSINPLDEDIF